MITKTGHRGQHTLIRASSRLTTPLQYLVIRPLAAQTVNHRFVLYVSAFALFPLARLPHDTSDPATQHTSPGLHTIPVTEYPSWSNFMSVLYSKHRVTHPFTSFMSRRSIRYVLYTQWPRVQLRLYDHARSRASELLGLFHLAAAPVGSMAPLYGRND